MGKQYLENQMEHQLCLMYAPGVKKKDRKPNQITSKETLRKYRSEARRAGRAIHKEFGVRDWKKVTHEQVQWYIDKLKAVGLSACSQHNACAALCKLYGWSMSTFEKDSRSYLDITKGRSDEPLEPKNEVEELEDNVGVRRAELMDFYVKDVIRRPEGLCIMVWQGKGGKTHPQLILPMHEAYVLDYIKGRNPNEYLVPRELAYGKENLHAFRREVSREAYDYYESRLATEPHFREELKQLCLNRAEEFNKDLANTADWKRIDHPYITRPRDGSPPRVFDRLALLATSIFHLSHWRCDVAVRHYIVK